MERVREFISVSEYHTCILGAGERKAKSSANAAIRKFGFSQLVW
tara:strand:+ start:35 stop:166 length:132 start_codon:yes stop_codon:yes gene_type:complete